jgi:hypothetical protein
MWMPDVADEAGHKLLTGLQKSFTSFIANEHKLQHNEQNLTSAYLHKVVISAFN